MSNVNTGELTREQRNVLVTMLMDEDVQPHRAMCLLDEELIDAVASYRGEEYTYEVIESYAQ